MVQNAVRWEAETGRRFEPLAVDVGAATNVLVRCTFHWLCACISLLHAHAAANPGWATSNGLPLQHCSTGGLTGWCPVVLFTRPLTAPPLLLPARQDRWICAASRSLTAFVREEMEAYR